MHVLKGHTYCNFPWSQVSKCAFVLATNRQMWHTHMALSLGRICHRMFLLWEQSWLFRPAYDLEFDLSFICWLISGIYLSILAMIFHLVNRTKSEIGQMHLWANTRSEFFFFLYYTNICKFVGTDVIIKVYSIRHYLLPSTGIEHMLCWINLSLPLVQIGSVQIDQFKLVGFL